jgi:hypothetical protein
VGGVACNNLSVALVCAVTKDADGGFAHNSSSGAADPVRKGVIELFHPAPPTQCRRLSCLSKASVPSSIPTHRHGAPQAALCQWPPNVRHYPHTRTLLH